jgi:hypothetical protein
MNWSGGFRGGGRPEIASQISSFTSFDPNLGPMVTPIVVTGRDEELFRQ